MSSRGARDRAALHRMTERALFVAVKGSLCSRPSAGAPLTESAARQHSEKPARPNQRLKKKKTDCAAKIVSMHLQTHSSKTASRQKFPRCGFASSGNRLERRTSARVWQRRRSELASGLCVWGNVDAFGANLPDENPNAVNGATPFKYNLRFPGQYFDVETGTMYNYFRDYDPLEGRYRQSDPIGLADGVNTYTYVKSSPLTFKDPFGLKTFREAATGAIRELVMGKAPDASKELAGKGSEYILGDFFARIICKTNGNPNDTRRCERECTQFIVAIKDSMIDALPRGPSQAARGPITREAGGMIDGCIGECSTAMKKHCCKPN
jgi:RHS repeat-associated protein